MTIKTEKQWTKLKEVKDKWFKFLKRISRDVFVWLMIIFLALSLFSWSFSGLLSLFFMTLSILLLVSDTHFLTFTDAFKVLIVFSGLFIVAGLVPGIYEIPLKEKPIKIKNIVFTDSTEKIAVYLDNPQKTIILRPNTDEFYTLRENRDDINFTTFDSCEFSHIGYIAAKPKIKNKDLNKTICEKIVPKLKIHYGDYEKVVSID